MIEFKNVEKYYGDFHALKNINLTITKGEVVVVIGPSGSGKSTMLRCINALEEITTGHLLINNIDLASKDTNLNHVRKNLGNRLSGGEKRRTEIARALATNPKLQDQVN